MSAAVDPSCFESGRSVSSKSLFAGIWRAYSLPLRVASIRSPTENQHPASLARDSSADVPENQWNTQRHVLMAPVFSRTSSTHPADLTEWIDIVLSPCAHASHTALKTRIWSFLLWRCLAPRSRPTSPTHDESRITSNASLTSVFSLTHQGWMPAATRTFWDFERRAFASRYSLGDTVQQSAETPSLCACEAASIGLPSQLRCTWASKRPKFAMSLKTLPSTCYSLGLLYLLLMPFAHEAQCKEIHRGRDAQDLRSPIQGA